MFVLPKAVWLLMIVLLSCNNARQAKSDESAHPEIQLSDIQLTDLNGKFINLNQHKGKIVFINFWATWCKPCLEEMPSIQKVQKIFKDDNIVFLIASDETVEQIEEFRNINNYSFNYVKVENFLALNIMALPTTFIFNLEGKLVFSEMGYRKWDSEESIDLIKNLKKSK